MPAVTERVLANQSLLEVVAEGLADRPGRRRRRTPCPTDAGDTFIGVNLSQVEDVVSVGVLPLLIGFGLVQA